MNAKYFEVIHGKILGFFPKLEDGKYKIIEMKRIRSPEQNRLYWGYILKLIVIMYKEAGFLHTKDHIHELFKKCFLPRSREKSDFSKKYVRKVGSTTTLNTKQFSEYINNIKVICEFGKLGEIPGLETIESFIIKDIGEDELLDWIDKII